VLEWQLRANRRHGARGLILPNRMVSHRHNQRNHMNWYDRIFAMFIGFTMTVISSLVLFGLTEKLTVGPAINPSEPGSGGGEVLMFVSASPLVLPGCVLLGLLIGVSAALLYCRLFRRQEPRGAQKVITGNPRHSVDPRAFGPHERLIASRGQFAGILFSLLTFVFLPTSTRDNLFFWMFAIVAFFIAVGGLASFLRKKKRALSGDQ
jgi:hypothetical protein